MRTTASRISQLLFLLTFIILFTLTDYRGRDEISLAVNAFFRADPLILVGFMFSTLSFNWLLFPGLLMFIFSAAIGRFFCGWICPLGTILDFVTVKINKSLPLIWLTGNIKYYFLAVLLFTSLFGVNLVGIFDPIALLVRFLALICHPLLGSEVRKGWVGLYRLLGDNRDYLAESYDFLKTYLLPFRETFYPLAFFSLALFSFIIYLERFEKRNWCRNLCPLGTLLGLVGTFSLFQRLPSRLCSDCGDCKDHCPTAFDSEIFQKSDCIACLNCQAKCRYGRVSFRPGFAVKSRTGFSPVRRLLLSGLGSGFLLSRAFSFQLNTSEKRLIRPPGVKSENEFRQKCVRCGECMKVCPRNALYPAYLQTGLYALFTPILLPRLGYCEYNCSLCGQVCPTGAIPNLPLSEKKASVIGLAIVDRNHCLPYARKLNCIVCEEHCPIPEKAIRFELVQESDYDGNKIILKKPYVVERLCNGCGICEYVCPIEEKAAIEVFPKIHRKI